MDATELLRTGKYSGLTIKCDGHTFKVHRAHICLKSAVIAAECDKDTLEKQSGVIEHTVFDAATVYRMLEFVYTKTYNTEASATNQVSQRRLDTATAAPNREDQHQQSSEASGPDRTPASANFTAELIAHINVYGIGDYYAMGDLQDLAKTRIASLAKGAWPVNAANNFADVVEHACRVTAGGEKGGLRQSCTPSSRNTDPFSPRTTPSSHASQRATATMSIASASRFSATLGSRSKSRLSVTIVARTTARESPMRPSLVGNNRRSRFKGTEIG